MLKKILLGVICLLMAAAGRGHADPLESMAQQLARGVSQLKTGRVAVLLFPYDNGDLSSGSSLVSERLTTWLAQRKHVIIIERSRLSSVLGEVRLEESGVTESTPSARAGGILGVDAVVTGTLDDHLDGETEINARLIRIDTGEILAAAAASIDRTWDDRPQAPAGPDDEEDDDPSHYVMHASPLIFTPQASRGRVIAAAPETTYVASPVPASAASQELQVTAPVTTVIYTSGSTERHRRDHDADRPHSAAHAQALYALGITLDTQGHRRQAEHFYRRLLDESPAPTALRERAEGRLAANHSHNHSAD